MTSSRSTPTHKSSVTRMPSFASCFRATVPVSPQQACNQPCLAGHSCIPSRWLRLDDFEDDGQCGYGAVGTEYQDQRHSHRMYKQRGPSIMQLGKHSSFIERPARRLETLYASEGEQEMARKRTGDLKLAKQRTMRERAWSEGYFTLETSRKENVYESEGETYGYRRVQTKNVIQGAMRKKVAEMEVCDNSGETLKWKTGGSKREKARKEGVYGEVGDSPRRASIARKMKEACIQVLETARRGSPHVSELFVGNQLLMQVTGSSLKSMAPSYGCHVFPANQASMFTSPARSTS